MTDATPQFHNAYARANREGLDSRAIESAALLKCAAGLEEASSDGAVPGDVGVEAVKRNMKLWTLFQIGLADPQNPLPREIKVNLLNLSRYVDKQSLRFLDTADPSILKGLIFINRNLAAGLSATPSAAEGQSSESVTGALESQA